MKILLEKNGFFKELNLGINWWIMFFGIFAMLYYKLYKLSIISFIIACIISAINPILVLLPYIVISFIANKTIMENYILDGYKIIINKIEDKNIIENKMKIRLTKDNSNIGDFVKEAI